MFRRFKKRVSKNKPAPVVQDKFQQLKEYLMRHDTIEVKYMPAGEMNIGNIFGKDVKEKSDLIQKSQLTILGLVENKEGKTGIIVEINNDLQTQLALVPNWGVHYVKEVAATNQEPFIWCNPASLLGAVFSEGFIINSNKCIYVLLTKRALEIEQFLDFYDKHQEEGELGIALTKAAQTHILSRVKSVARPVAKQEEGKQETVESLEDNLKNKLQQITGEDTNIVVEAIDYKKTTINVRLSTQKPNNPLGLQVGSVTIPLEISEISAIAGSSDTQAISGFLIDRISRQQVLQIQ